MKQFGKLTALIALAFAAPLAAQTAVLPANTVTQVISTIGLGNQVVQNNSTYPVQCWLSASNVAPSPSTNYTFQVNPVTQPGNTQIVDGTQYAWCTAPMAAAVAVFPGITATGGGGGGGGPVTIADGADITKGAKADAAYAGTGSGSIISIEKGIYGLLAAPLPTGAATIGAVNVNGTVPVSGTFFQATQPISGAASVFLDGSDVTQGTKADAAWTSGSGSLIALLKAIDRDTLLPLNAGTAIIGKAGIDQTTPGTTNGVQTLSGSVTAATQSGTWNIGSITTLPALAAGANTIGITNQGTAATLANAWSMKITDATNGPAAVKAASTAAAATDPALVVAISPNNTVPTSLAALPTLANVTTVATVSAITAATLAAPAPTTDIASAAITVTTTSAAVATLNQQAMAFTYNVTTVSGTTPTDDAKVQECADAAGTINCTDIYHFSRATAATVEASPLIRVSGASIKYVETLSGTTPSFTRTMTRKVAQITAPLERRFYDRAIVFTTLSSTTAAFNIEGATQITLNVSQTAGTSAATAQIQVSDDNANWVNFGTATALGTGAVNTNVYNGQIATKWVRLIVTVAGTATTYNYVSIHAR